MKNLKQTKLRDKIKEIVRELEKSFEKKKIKGDARYNQGITDCYRPNEQGWWKLEDKLEALFLKTMEEVIGEDIKVPLFRDRLCSCVYVEAKAIGRCLRCQQLEWFGRDKALLKIRAKLDQLKERK